MEKTLGNEDPVVMFKGKKASGLVKPKQRKKPIASRDCAHQLLKTNRKPIASLTVHTTSGDSPPIRGLGC
jgi:hypothetical protein